MPSPESRVTAEELLAGLRELGLVPADLVFIHASLSRFGHLEGGADTVIQTLLEAIGPRGTLAMPGFSFQLREEPSPVFDVRNTPCWASRIYERFRRLEGVCRSHHVTHSVCAIGARARELTATHSVTPCGRESPFRKLVAWSGKIVLFGVCHNSNTTFHAVEEEERPFYVGFRELKGVTIVDERGRRRPLLSKVHEWSRHYDFNRMNDTLEREGVQRRSVIGDSIVRCVDARRMFEVATEALRRDPEALLMQGGAKIQLPVSVQRSGE